MDHITAIQRITPRTLTITKKTGIKGQVAKVAVQIDNAGGCVLNDMIFAYDGSILSNGRAVIGTTARNLGWDLVYNNLPPQTNLYTCMYGAGCMAAARLYTCMYGISLPVGSVTLLELWFDILSVAKIGDKAIISWVKCGINDGGIPAIPLNGSITVIG